MAANRRYGYPIVIVDSCGQSAPVCFRHGRQRNEDPIVLVLADQHYQLAKLKPGAAWPKDWLALPDLSEATSVSNFLFWGAGDWRPPDSPQSKASTWRPAGSPQSTSSTWRPKATAVGSHDSLSALFASARSLLASPPPKEKNSVFLDGGDGFAPDACPYPRHKCSADWKKPKVFREQSWTCPICQFHLRVPAGPKARKRLISNKDNHLFKHTKAERASVPRLNQGAPVAVASSVIPPENREWTCFLCGKGCSWFVNRHARDLAINKHFQEYHPDCTPTEAYRSKQRTDPAVRARMSDRGKHVGLIKRKKAEDRLADIKDMNGHDLTFLVLKRDPKNHHRGQVEHSSHLCKSCWKLGMPADFRKACHGFEQRAGSWSKLCLLVRESQHNLNLFRQLLDLSHEELASL